MDLASPRRPIVAAALLGAAAQAAFLIRVAVPSKPVFDEVHYVPAARALLALSAPVNIEHPLLGKLLMAAGMALFGDNSLGWRFFSTFAATMVVLAAFAILQLSYGRVRTSAVGAFLVLLNGTVFVQARIAMLDGYMAAFLMAGIAGFLWAMQRGGWRRWLATAAAFGCAVACKWTALPFAAVAGLAFLLLKRAAPQRFAGVGLVSGVLGYGAMLAAVYLATFAPAFLYHQEPMTLARLLPFQAEMYARQTQVLPPHTYQSAWWTWPLMRRPVWYLYEPVDGAQRGILMIGNPAVMWGGLVAVLACFAAWVTAGDRRPLAFALMWGASVAIWAAIPKSLGFYYYYYPSSILICLCLAAAFDHWRARVRPWDECYLILVVGAFGYFFPVYAALPLHDSGAFTRWTWLASWV